MPFLRLESGLGGHSQISGDDYIEGAPELIIEIAASSTDYDLKVKFEVYQHCDVQEYIVWQTEDEQFDWFRLIEGVYVPLTGECGGHHRKSIFPRLTVSSRSIVSKGFGNRFSGITKGVGHL